MERQKRVDSWSVCAQTRGLALAVALTSLSVAGSAKAGDVALAESLFREGRALMEKGDYKTACPKLAESLAQDTSTGTQLALALCQEQIGQTASAWANFSGVVTRAHNDGRADREQAAKEHMAALEPKLAHLTIAVDATGATPGLVVKRDGVELGQGAWGTAAPVDPGQHSVEVTAPGKLPWKASVMVRASESYTLSAPPLSDAPAAGGVAAKPTQITPPADTDAPSSGPPLRTIGLVTGAVGIVGLGVSGFFALRATSLNNDSKANAGCNSNNQCTAEALAKRDDAVSASKVATVALVAGGVLTAAGATLFFVGGPKKNTDSASLQAAPSVGPGFSGVLMSGKF